MTVHGTAGHAQRRHWAAQQVLETRLGLGELPTDLLGPQATQHAMGHAVRPDGTQRGLQTPEIPGGREERAPHEVGRDEKERGQAPLG